MAPPKEPEVGSFDFRVYLGIIIFRWKIIVLCFLYALLAGVLYLQFTEAQYVTFARIRVQTDSLTKLPSPQSPPDWGWHLSIVEGDCRLAAEKVLHDEWAPRIGVQNLMPWVSLSYVMGNAGVVDFTIHSPHREYAIAFLQEVVNAHRAAWERTSEGGVKRADQVIKDELGHLDQMIDTADDEAIEYQRVHRLPIVEAKSAMEGQLLSAILARTSQLKMEQYLIEVQHPLVKQANAGILQQVNDLTRQSGAMRPVGLSKEVLGRLDDMAKESGEEATGASAEPLLKEAEGYYELKAKLYMAQEREAELAQKFTAEHPEVQHARSEITGIQAQLDALAKTQLEQLMERNSAITMQLKALEEAQYQWEGKYFQTSRQRLEYGRLQSNADRYKGAYNELYTRVFQLKLAQQVERARYDILSSPSAGSTPTWPNPRQVLMLAIMLGLGGGIGLAFVLHVLDNRVQSIADVEKSLGLPFLGGVPYWVHSNLERTIRPIVTEEFSAGAVEAYRALRTSVLSAADKAGEKIIIVTSADAKEGKTLTTLNLAIMIAQTGRKVLLCDMDLRRGRLHRSLEVSRTPGLTDALHDGKPLEDVVTQTRHPNLWFAPSGDNKEEVAEDLHGADLVSFFSRARQQYDYILVDTAPILRVTDSVIVATQGLGVVVYVAHVNRTAKPLIRYSLDLLRNAKVIGVIMNAIEMHTISGLYYSYQYPNYAYYSNAYAYGYTYGYYYDQDGKNDGKNRFWRRRRRAPGKSGQGLKSWLKQHLFPTE